MPFGVLDLLFCWGDGCRTTRIRKVWDMVPLCIFWCLWWERNARCFEGIERNVLELKGLVLRTLMEWTKASGALVFSSVLDFLESYSEMLRYAYAELEESRGAIQSAKKIYESLLGDVVNTTALAHIQFIRFLRRTEGVEAARKYFLDSRKSPNCTYHVYVAYAMMAFCLDKDPKIAHNVFEAGLKRFMHEPVYILEDFEYQFVWVWWVRMALDSIELLECPACTNSLHPPIHQVWKRFTHFEQTYGDLASMLKVEQRRKEALSRTGEEGASALEGSLQDVVSRYTFMDLWPCSSKDLDHLARQEWLAKNINKKMEKSALPNGPGSVGMEILPSTTASSNLSNPIVSIVGGGTTNAFDEILKATPPSLVAFLASLPAVEGPAPDVDIVLSICLQSDIPAAQTGKSGTSPMQLSGGPAPSLSDVSGSSKAHHIPSGSSFKPTRDRQSGKRKDLDRQEDDDTATVQSQPLARDVFRIRQIQKARAGTTSQTGSASYGSALSGDLSGSTG
uniref:Suppressor of forked domain-containing protein n=1 Tax=Fagus sylvatica TaxID=28930 RepID=A0A2N9JAP0_FAGSY